MRLQAIEKGWGFRSTPTVREGWYEPSQCASYSPAPTNSPFTRPFDCVMKTA